MLKAGGYFQLMQIGETENPRGTLVIDKRLYSLLTASRHKFDNDRCLELRKRDMWSMFRFHFEYARKSIV